MSSRRLGALFSAAVSLFVAGLVAATSLTAPNDPHRRRATGTVVSAVAAAPARAPEATGTATRVVVWGDSLVKEATQPFVSAVSVAGARVETYSFGGSAPCDWTGHVRERLAGPDITVALLEFSGNALTPCMQDSSGMALTGSAFFDKYIADVEGLALSLRDRGATVYLVGPPVLSPKIDQSRVPGLLDRYRALADRHDQIEFVDAGRAVLADGAYVEWLPCQPFEDAARGCVNGRIRVRSPDGVHFCPVRRVADDCPTYSSGAARFGVAMAAAVTSRQ